jgi:hypothetical protein
MRRLKQGLNQTELYQNQLATVNLVLAVFWVDLGKSQIEALG